MTDPFLRHSEMPRILGWGHWKVAPTAYVPFTCHQGAGVARPKIDDTEKTNTTGTAAVISDSSLADDAEMTLIVVNAGTGAKGGKAYIYLTRA